jgi:hypothetical protein
MFTKKIEVAIPGRLWRQILAANAGDDQLAHCNLAIACLVAAQNIADPVVPARRREPPVFFPCDPPSSPRDPVMPPQELLDANAGSYLVTEGLPAEMPVMDPWGRSWD